MWENDLIGYPFFQKYSSNTRIYVINTHRCKIVKHITISLILSIHHTYIIITERVKKRGPFFCISRSRHAVCSLLFTFEKGHPSDTLIYITLPNDVNVPRRDC